MTDGIDQALANAGLALLAADVGPPPLAVFDGFVPPNTARPYVLVYIPPPEWAAATPKDSLDGMAGSPTVRWYAHCVADSENASRAVAQRVRTQLLNQRPVIAGLNVGIIRQESTSPPVRDESTGTPVFDAVAVYVLNATT